MKRVLALVGIAAFVLALPVSHVDAAELGATETMCHLPRGGTGIGTVMNVPLRSALVHKRRHGCCFDGNIIDVDGEDHFEIVVDRSDEFGRNRCSCASMPVAK